MKKMQTLLAAAFAATLVFAAGSALAASAGSTNLLLTTTIASKAQLTVPSVTVNFDDTALGDPDAVPQISGSSTPTITAKVRTSGGAGLTVYASGDFTSGANTIPVSNVSTTASGSFAAIANMPKTLATAATLGSGWASGTYTGDMVFGLLNSWSYVPGAYSTVTLNYTLTAP